MGMKYRDPNTGQLKEISLKTADTLPIGAVIAYSGSNEPSGWLICDGRAISRTSYSSLFNVIGTTYGAGDGSTTFNLPDYRDRVPVGLDSNDSDFNTLGKTGGEKKHTLTVNEMPAHKHELTIEGGGSLRASGVKWLTGNNLRKYAGDMIENAGGNQPHNNVQPYIVTNYIIKAEKSVGILGKILNIFSKSDKDSYSCKYINDTYGGGIKNYSTNEVKLNEKWIDGKPIYRKVVNMGNLLNNSGKSVKHGLSNFVIRTINGSATNGSTTIGISGFNDEVYISKTDVIWNTKVNRSSFTAYVVLEYTKTTD